MIFFLFPLVDRNSKELELIPLCKKKQGVFKKFPLCQKGDQGGLNILPSQLLWERIKRGNFIIDFLLIFMQSCKTLGNL